MPTVTSYDIVIKLEWAPYITVAKYPSFKPIGYKFKPKMKDLADQSHTQMFSDTLGGLQAIGDANGGVTKDCIIAVKHLRVRLLLLVSELKTFICVPKLKI